MGVNIEEYEKDRFHESVFEGEKILANNKIDHLF